MIRGKEVCGVRKMHFPKPWQSGGNTNSTHLLSEQPAIIYYYHFLLKAVLAKFLLT